MSNDTFVATTKRNITNLWLMLGVVTIILLSNVAFYSLRPQLMTFVTWFSLAVMVASFITCGFIVLAAKRNLKRYLEVSKN